MGCAQTIIHHEKGEFLKDDQILSDDLEMSDETCANYINDSIRINESILNRKLKYEEEIEDFSIVQEQLLPQKPFIMKSCFAKNNKTQQFKQKEKKVRFSKSFQIIINGLKFTVKKKKQRKSKKENTISTFE